ncbi:hypothetical protein FQA39_LY12859 [Lamprigera yunnana]|nr:hypothetical protein FQA39_LY12859 [Lamprigera yunnana]
MKEIKETVEFLKSRIKEKIDIAIILGSGLGNLTNELEIIDEIPFEEIPHFTKSSIVGHESKHVNAYDRDTRSKIKTIAKDLDIDLKEGVYAYFKGPMYETPAEIMAYKALGADSVGMSTVPEVTAAVHAQMNLKKATKPLKLEELMTQACKKQVEAATAEYKIEIAELKSKDQIKDAKLEASDKRIQQLESESQIKSSNIETLTAKTHNLEKENLIFKLGGTHDTSMQKASYGATAEYKVRLEASDKEITELKNRDQIKDATIEASDKEIQQLKEQNIVLTNALTKAGLL